MQITVALPDSLVSDSLHLRGKTEKVGMIGRCCAMYQVNTVYVYEDGKGVHSRDGELMKTLLEYMETPQYLRRRAFRKQPSLQYAGVLPPLRTPHHKLNVHPDQIKIGEIREGVIISEKKQLYADVGLTTLVPLEGKAYPGQRATLVFTSQHPNLRCMVSAEVKEYWGYKVKQAGSLGELLKNNDAKLKILTSRRGQPIHIAWGGLKSMLHRSEKVLVGFGSPKRGIFDILSDEGLDPLNVAEYVLNFIPEQGVATVRSEEALAASLAVINVAKHLS